MLTWRTLLPVTLRTPSTEGTPGCKARDPEKPASDISGPPYKISLPSLPLPLFLFKQSASPMLRFFAHKQTLSLAAQ